MRIILLLVLKTVVSPCCFIWTYDSVHNSKYFLNLDVIQQWLTPYMGYFSNLLFFTKYLRSNIAASEILS